MTTQIYDFLTPAEYTYDSAKLEITGGQAQLIRTAPAAGQFYAPFTTDEDETWYNVPGTLVGGAVIGGGKIIMTGALIKYCHYTIPLSFTASQGCFRIAVTPNYSGSPAGERTYGVASKAHGDSTNLIELKHRVDGFFNLEVHDLVDTTIINTGIAAWNPTAGQEYLFELNWDFTAGATRLFIDGVQNGATITNTCVRGIDVTSLRVGTNFDASIPSDYSARHFTIYGTPQNTTDHTITLADFVHTLELYPQDNPTVVPVTVMKAESISAFTPTVNAVGDDMTFTLNVDGTEMYWDGGAWAASSGYAQSNLGPDVNTNIAALTLLSTGSTVIPTIYSPSISGTPVPYISNLTVVFDYKNPPDLEPAICTVSGYILDSTNTPIGGATIEVRPSKDFTINGKNYFVIRQWTETTSEVTGYFELEVIQSVEADGDPILYDFKFTDGETETTVRNKTVPTQAAVDFNDIV